MSIKGFPGGSVVRNPSANAGDVGFTFELGRSLGEGNGNPLQYSSLRNSFVDSSGVKKRVGHDLATKQQQQHMSIKDWKILAPEYPWFCYLFSLLELGWDEAWGK